MDIGITPAPLTSTIEPPKSANMTTPYLVLIVDGVIITGLIVTLTLRLLMRLLSAQSAATTATPPITPSTGPAATAPPSAPKTLDQLTLE